MAENHNCGLAKSNLAILKSSAYADMTVRCDSTEFKLHRAIVCPRSKFFAAACDGQFQVCGLQIRFDGGRTVVLTLLILGGERLQYCSRGG